MTALIEDWKPVTRYTEPPERRMRTVPCACGGHVRADRLFPAAGISHHSRTKPHREWRARNGL
jgi:hypothetical protein